MREKVYLIDGSSFLYRFYYAIKGLSYNGFPTGAIYGFAKLLIDIENTKPKYVAIFFDTKEKTFREDLLEIYKKNRPKMPDELSVQIQPIKELIDAFGITRIELDGFEADDLIATYAEKLKEKYDIVIVASDKDLFQLVEDRVVIFDPTKKVYYDRNKVYEKLGVYPEQVSDYLALVGDSIDNIPGVKSIGPKTAAQLLNEFKSIDEILKNLDKLKPKIRKAIKNENNLEIYRKLTKVDRNSPIEIDLESLKKHDPDFNKIKTLFIKFGFKSLMDFIPEENNKNPIQLKNETPIVVAQTGGAIIIENGEIKHIEPAFFSRKKEIAVYDFKKLLSDGFRFEKQPFDIKLACYLINPDSKGNIDSCFAGINDELHLKLAQLDTFEEKLIFGLEPTKHTINEHNLEYLLHDVETPLSQVLVSMETRGIKIDSGRLIGFKSELENKLATIEEKIYREAGERFNINSTKELQHILFEKLRIKPVKKTKTGYSTDSESLQVLAENHEIAQLIIVYRTITKVISTYINPFLKKMDKNGRIHTTFNQTLTATGRLSSSNPNLQNLPAGDDEFHAGIRQSVVAEEGYKLICSDYSQIELRVLAHLSQDETLIEIFNNDEDIHTQTAVKLFGVHPSMVDHNLRRMAKTINFGILYGMGYVSLAKTLNIPKSKAKEIIETYFSRFSKVRDYINKTIEEATKNKYVKTYFNRRRYFFNIDSENKRLAEFEKRAAVNATIQGTAADIIKIAMVKLYDKLKNFDAHLLLQVHDELLIEARNDVADKVARITKETMESVVSFNVPLKAKTKIAENWYDAK